MNIPMFVQVFLAVVFLYSSIAKWFSFSSFKETIYQLKVSMLLSTIGAVTVPIAEMGAAGLLLFRSTLIYGEIVTLLLLCSFVWSVQRARGKFLDCNCFGGLLTDHFGKSTYIRIAFLFVLCLFLLVAQAHKDAIETSWIDIVSYALASWGILVCYALASTVRKYKQVYS